VNRYFKIIQEGILFVWHEFLVHKGRTFLTLLGISIGIFCVVSVFSVVDSLKKNIESSIDELGTNVLFIEKWPWSFSSDYPWWKYWKRPIPTLYEMEELQRRSISAEHIVFIATTQTKVSKASISMPNISLQGTTLHYPEVMRFDLQDGRFITENEFNSGAHVAVIGSEIAKGLNIQNIQHEKIKLFGQSVQIVGIFKEEGMNSMGRNHDNIVLVSVRFYRKFTDMQYERNNNTSIAYKVKPNISNEQAKDEITGIMRSLRNLKPQAEENFSINETSLISQGVENIFSVISITAWIIGSFSLLVGGFGIANIMFVSVKERTRIIGIQKAIGAKNSTILTQFLIESVILSIVGGIAGLLIVIILALIVSSSTSFPLFVSIQNILLAVFISGSIGIISGIAPAWVASRLDPVVAIRT
jgi:putative ABC transport system permease protein